MNSDQQDRHSRMSAGYRTPQASSRCSSAASAAGAVPLVCPPFPLFRVGGVGFAVQGRRIVLSHNRSHASAHGQWRGRCTTGLRCGRASRAGTPTSMRRRVAARATR